jgi:hypothetical protein
MQPTDAFAELGRIRFHETPFDEVLTRVADLAKRTVPGADEVSITLVGKRWRAHRRQHRRTPVDR